MTFHNLVIGKRAIAYFLGFVALGLLLFLTLRDMEATFKTRITGQMARQQLLSARSISGSIQAEIESLFEDLTEAGEFITASPLHRGDLEAAVQSLFSPGVGPDDRHTRPSHPSVLSVRWLDPSGDERAHVTLDDTSSSSSAPIDMVRDALWPLLRAEKAGPCVIGPIAYAGGVHALWLATPLGDDGTGGFLAAELDFDRLLGGIYQGDPESEPDLFILNDEGTLIYSLERPDMHGNNVLEDNPECLRCHEDLDVPRSMVRGREGWKTWKTPDEEKYVAFTPLMLGDMRCSIALAVPEQPLASAIGHFRARSWAALLLLFGLFALTASLVFELRRKHLVTAALRSKNAELERANAELRELDRLKNNFISTISHELRTPLTSIKASVDMLLAGMVGDLDAKKREILTICRRNSDRLMRVVDDLLEIQGLESGRNRLDLKPLDIDDVIRDVVDRAEQNPEKKNAGDIRLLTRFGPARQRRTILGDRARISRALSNLVSNAIKFTDRGTIVVKREYRDDVVQVSVSDQGAGIPEEMKEEIFDKFTQVDGGMTRERGGLGLGLALTRTIVEKHGGRIWVESRPGSGSRFTFTLPCQGNGGGDEGGGSGGRTEG